MLVFPKINYMISLYFFQINAIKTLKIKSKGQWHLVVRLQIESSTPHLTLMQWLSNSRKSHCLVVQSGLPQEHCGATCGTPFISLTRFKGFIISQCRRSKGCFGGNFWPYCLNSWGIYKNLGAPQIQQIHFLTSFVFSIT